MKMSAVQFCGDTKYFYSGKSNMNECSRKRYKKNLYMLQKKNQIFWPKDISYFRKMGFVIFKCVRQAQGSEYR